MKLEKSNIIDIAFELLNEVGLDEFKLRALAVRLSVSATALYWHFSNKDELISAMANRFYSQAYNKLLMGDSSKQCLLTLGSEFKAALNGFRDGARLCAIAKPIESNSQENSKKISAPLVAQGLDQETALSYEAVIISFVLGWSIYNQNKPVHAHLDEMFNFDQSFEIGLKAIIQGLSLAEGTNN